MGALLIAAVGAYGVYLLYTSLAFGWRGRLSEPGFAKRQTRRRRARDWMAQAGLNGVRPAELATVMAVLFLVSATATYSLFGGILPAAVAGAFASSAPIASYRARRARIRDEAREAWPRLIEEIRLQTTSRGRSIPQALLEVGRRGPEDLRPAFAAAEREWSISTDFGRTVGVLKDRLADPTADAACETLLVAHEVGGSDVDRRLAALVEDRIQDLEGRKDARAKQAGVRCP